MTIGRRGFAALLTAIALVAATPLLLGAGSTSTARAQTAGSPPTPPKPPKVVVPSAAPRATSGTPFVCGEVATASISLTSDENCGGSNGIVAGANGITINLNGHTLSGDGTHVGVSDSGYNNVTVENGVIYDFANGVLLTGNTVHATNLRVEGNGTFGIFTAGDKNVVSNNYVFANVDGIVMESGNGGQATGNWAESNSTYGIYLWGLTAMLASNNKALNGSGAGVGFVIEADVGSVTGNVANGNAGDGFYFYSAGSAIKPTVTVSNNRAAFNGALGLDSTVDGAIDGGGNVVQSNATATQCVNLVCHGVAN